MKRKGPVKPIFDLKHDFMDSLEAVLHQAMMLQSSVQSAIDLDQVTPAIKELLQERVNALDTVLLSRE